MCLSFSLCGRKCGGLGPKRVQQYAARQFAAVVVRKPQCGVGKPQAVHFMYVAQVFHQRYVAVGNKVKWQAVIRSVAGCLLLCPEIVVFECAESAFGYEYLKRRTLSQVISHRNFRRVRMQ